MSRFTLAAQERRILFKNKEARRLGKRGVAFHKYDEKALAEFKALAPKLEADPKWMNASGNN